MFQLLMHRELTQAPGLRESMLRDRALQFVVRHGWALPVSEGLELDAFDMEGTRYAILSTGGRHAASIRLRSARDGSMVERVFPAFWDKHARLLRDLPEVTRLCLAPRAAPEWRADALGELLVGLCGHCLRTGVGLFFGVVYPSVARALGRAGWAPQIIDRMVGTEGPLLLGSWSVSHRVYWNLQERLEAFSLGQRHRLRVGCGAPDRAAERRVA